MVTKIKRLLIVIPQVVRVSTLVHMWQISISKLNTFAPVSCVTYIKVAFRAQQNAVAEQIRTFVASWFPVMWLPAPVSAFGSVSSSEPFTTGGALFPLPFPSLLFSIGGKSHLINSRSSVKWVKNDDMWVLLRDGKSYNIAIMYFPPSSFSQRARAEYRIFKGSRIIGFCRTLEAAKRRAEKIKTQRRAFK